MFDTPTFSTAHIKVSTPSIICEVWMRDIECACFLIIHKISNQFVRFFKFLTPPRKTNERSPQWLLSVFKHKTMVPGNAILLTRGVRVCNWCLFWELHCRLLLNGYRHVGGSLDEVRWRISSKGTMLKNNILFFIEQSRLMVAFLKNRDIKNNIHDVFV